MKYKTSIQGRPVNQKLTAGCQLCCLWKDGSTPWEKLSDLKKSHKVQTGKFVAAQGIHYACAEETGHNSFLSQKRSSQIFKEKP